MGPWDFPAGPSRECVEDSEIEEHGLCPSNPGRGGPLHPSNSFADDESRPDQRRSQRWGSRHKMLPVLD